MPQRPTIGRGMLITWWRVRRKWVISGPIFASLLDPVVLYPFWGVTGGKRAIRVVASHYLNDTYENDMAWFLSEHSLDLIAWTSLDEPIGSGAKYFAGTTLPFMSTILFPIRSRIGT